MIRLAVILLMAASIGLTATSAGALGVVNGSFENTPGHLAGWSRVLNGGAVQAVESHTSDLGHTWYPTDGQWFARLRAGCGDEWVKLFQRDIAGCTELSFDWFFDSREPLFRLCLLKRNDRAVGKIDGETIFEIDSEDVGASLCPWGGGETGWVHESVALDPNEEYRLVFKLMNDDDCRKDSFLGIDNVRCTVIPEPLTVLGVLGGLAGLGGYLRKRSR